jgi:hypothetical protein
MYVYKCDIPRINKLMPATRTKRLNNPLRKLRLILGEPNHPMPQRAFADLAGLSADSVRSVEVARRPMTKENCLNQIAINARLQEQVALLSRCTKLGDLENKDRFVALNLGDSANQLHLIRRPTILCTLQDFSWKK